MQQKRYEFLLEAETPVAHHEGNEGNNAIAMRRKVRLEDGTYARVPCITGDTMRHGLREASAYVFLDAAGLLENEVLTRAACRLLFSGGMVTGRGDTGAVSMDRYRELCELCPPLALLGGCCDSRVIPGRLVVEDPRLVCIEQQRYLPQWIKDAVPEPDTCRGFVDEQQRVRMDPMLDPGKRKLLLGSEQVEENDRLLKGEKAHEENDALARDDAKSTMLPRSFECLIQGSLFSWVVEATCYSDLEVDTLHVMLGAFLSRPVVGGKKATGHGRLRALEARGVQITRPKDSAEVLDVNALGARVGEQFRAHIAERKPRIKEWLSRVDA